MSMTDAEANDLATRYAATNTFVALFTADPGATGANTNEVTGGSPAYVRKAITWGGASSRQNAGTVTFDVPAGTTVTHVAACNGSTGSTIRDRTPVTGGSVTFASQGTLTVTVTFAVAP